MLAVSAVPESTYRHCYRGEQTGKPFVRYRTLPCIQIPLELPERVFMEQVDDQELVPLNFRLPAKREPQPKSAKKLPVQNSIRVFETKFGPMDMSEITRLCNKRRYDSVAQRAGRECDILPMYRPVPPSHTKEEKPDMIALRGRRYDHCSEDWQAAALWDRLQTRAPTERPKSPAERKLVLTREKVRPLKQDVEEQIESLVKTDRLANIFVRKVPGYAGYAPLCPPETPLDSKQENTIYTSTMKTSYRNFSDEDYIPQVYKLKGPMSKMVTLIAPCNPFNKIGVEIDGGDKNGRYQNILQS